ncbi:unnamed protein product [Ectocarpus sp. 12 AP-2014]
MHRNAVCRGRCSSSTTTESSPIHTSVACRGKRRICHYSGQYYCRYHRVYRAHVYRLHVHVDIVARDIGATISSYTIQVATKSGCLLLYIHPITPTHTFDSGV